LSNYMSVSIGSQTWSRHVKELAFRKSEITKYDRSITDTWSPLNIYSNYKCLLYSWVPIRTKWFLFLFLTNFDFSVQFFKFYFLIVWNMFQFIHKSVKLEFFNFSKVIFVQKMNQIIFWISNKKMNINLNIR